MTMPLQIPVKMTVPSAVKNLRSASEASGYRVEYRPTAIKDLDDIPAAIQERVFSAVDSLEKNPLPRRTKKIKKEKNRFRIRVGVYRVVYRVFFDEKLIMVEFVRHRKNIYKHLD